jgi:hypothetical protein
MKFEKHAFISYAHIDNQPISDEDEGWISNFHELLQSMVSMKLGEKVNIWRDNKLRGTDIFSDEIVQQFPKTAIFISVITPRYLNSEWCTKEVKEFHKVASESFGIRIENKSRILKVVKTPVDRDKLPVEVSEALGYEFYKMDENGRPKEFNKVFGDEYARAYLSRLDDLAYDIREIIDLINQSLEEALPIAEVKVLDEPGRKVKNIYVAHSSYDMSGSRDQLIRELKSHGYDILPHESLPIYAEELRKEVHEALEKADLAIHLVGKSYGAVPDGPEEKSAIMLQNEIAAQQSTERGLSRLIWLSHAEQVEDKRQLQFVKSLNENSQAQYGAELIEGSLEDFKTAIFDKIRQLEKQPDPSGEVDTEEKEIFLICDERDRKATIPLRKYLKSMNFEVTIPLFEGDPADIRTDTEKHLRNADAIILYYGEGDAFWKRSKQNEIKKLSQFQREKPLLANYIYLAHPDSADKIDMIEMEEEDMINGMGGFAPEIMQEFMKEIEKVTA